MSKIKKFFIVAFFVLMLFVLNQIDVEASVVTTAPDDFEAIEYDVSSLYSVNDDGTFTIQGTKTICNNYIIFYCSRYDEFQIIFYGDGYISSSHSKYILTDSSGYNRCYLVLPRDGSSSFGSVNFVTWSEDPFWQDYILDSYANILEEDGTIFFLKTPVTLGEIMEVEAKKQTITKEIVGCLGFLIPFLIFLIGFWKGLRFVLKLLRQS